LRPRLIGCALVGIVLIAGGCGTVPVAPDARPHILAMDPDGGILDLEYEQMGGVRGQEIEMAEFDPGRPCSESSPPGICDVLRGLDDRYQRARVLNLYIIAHGGLNTYRTSLKRVQEHLLEMNEPGNAQPEAIYPVFLVWNSSGLGSYWDHLTRIRRGTVWNVAARVTALPYALFDAVAVVASTPESWAVQVLSPLRSAWFNRDLPCIHVSLPTEGSLADRVRGPDDSGCGWGLRHFGFLIPTSAAKIVTTPVADTLGHRAWNVMLRRADLLVRNSAAAPDAGYDSDHVGGVEALMRAIDAKIASEEWDGSQVHITLIGHSMGAFIVNNIVRRFPDLPIERIVHMASADSLRSVEDAIEPYLARHANAQFHSLMLHPEREDLETHLLNTVPQGSLLTWIDNLYTSPPTRLDRTSGRWDNAGWWIHSIPSGIADQMCFRVFDYAGRGIPTEHGAFDDLRSEGPQYWTPAFWNGGGCNGRKAARDSN
jgi:pimeloyl-ACP methyl ester carboxylesterase